jgi:serum/glucocorticoid-regulated kinase 2
MSSAKKAKAKADKAAKAATTSVGSAKAAAAESGGTLDLGGGTARESSLSVDDFQILKVLGKGSFGKVMLVRKKSEGAKGATYAMKTLRKKELLKRKQIGHTQTERKILQDIDHPFLVGLKFAFQTEDKLYMVLEFMGGGELFHWLRIKKRFTENQSKLYAAEITLALGHLHSHNIIYRDLKPENILLDESGHLKLADFGLAKEGVSGAGAEGGATTFCGTPEYLAPEILTNKGHGKAVDWWSMGTLVFELMCGLPPFYDTNQSRMYNKIQTAEVKFPDNKVSAQGQQFILDLLERQVEKRLGSRQPDGEAQVKEHAWFSSLDFAQVMSKAYKPELVPPKSGAANFDEEFTSEAAIDSVVTGALSDAHKEKTAFKGFTYQDGGALGSE